MVLGFELNQFVGPKNQSATGIKLNTNYRITSSNSITKT